MVGQRLYTVSRQSLETIADVDRLSAIAERVVAAGLDSNDTAQHFLDGLQSRF